MKRKCSSSDFVPKMLPANRRKQYLDFFKTRFSILTKIFLMSFLFSLPFLISYCIKYFFILPNAYAQLKNDPDKYLAFFKLTNIIFYGVDLLNIAVLLIGYAGAFNIFKKMSWGEPISFYKDFFKGIKHNWSLFLVSALFLSVFRFAAKTYDILSSYHFTSYIIEAIFFLAIPILFVSLVIGEIYDVRIFECYQKATSYYFKKMGFALLFVVYLIALTVVRYFVEEVYGIALIGFLLMFLNLALFLPLIALMWHQFWLSCFDEVTNKEYFKDYYHKGLADNYSFNKRYRDEDTFLLK